MSNNPFNALDPAYLASLNNAYRAAEVKSKGITILPEGKYQAMISAYLLKPSKIYQDEMNLQLGFDILSGEHKGKTVYKYYSIIPEGLDMLKTDMVMLGIDLQDDITKLGDELIGQSILQTVVDITIRHKKAKNSERIYQNVYINRVAGNASEAFMEVDDDESPFD